MGLSQLFFRYRIFIGWGVCHSWSSGTEYSLVGGFVTAALQVQSNSLVGEFVTAGLQVQSVNRGLVSGSWVGGFENCTFV